MTSVTTEPCPDANTTRRMKPTSDNCTTIRAAAINSRRAMPRRIAIAIAPVSTISRDAIASWKIDRFIAAPFISTTLFQRTTVHLEDRFRCALDLTGVMADLNDCALPFVVAHPVLQKMLNRLFRVCVERCRRFVQQEDAR